MGRRKKNHEEPIVVEKYDDFYGENITDTDNISHIFESENKENKSARVVTVPVVGKIGKNKVIVNYKGYGIAVITPNTDVDTLKLKVQSDIGYVDFSYEVV